MRKPIRCTAVITLFILSLTACANEWIKSNQNIEVSSSQWVQKILAGMTLEQKIGQMIGLRYTGRFFNQDSESFAELKSWICGFHIGGFIQVRGGVYETAALTNTLQKMADIPLLIAADLERGLGNQLEGATLFPPFMSLGAAGSEEFAYAMGRITAVEARAVGIHMTYAPVVDVNNNPDNPIINVRSFGEDPQTVGRLAAAFIQGCQDHGLIATAKHFPGHGDTAIDSHSALPVIRGDMAKLQNMELFPFQAAIDAGVLAIMSAHLRLPALDPALRVPATLSAPIITELLRNRLGFEGLVVTDAMEMGGITSLYTPEDAAVKAVQAGVDMLLLPPRTESVILALVQAVNQQKIPVSRIDASVRRILRIKAGLGLHKQRTVDLRDVDKLVNAKPHRELARKVVDHSLTLIQDTPDLLPLASVGQRISVFSLSSDPGGYFMGQAFVRALGKRNTQVTAFYADVFTGEEFIQKALQRARRADVRIIAVFSRLSDGKGSVGMHERHIRLIRDLAKSTAPVVVVSFNSPYFLRQFPEVDTYLCAFRHSEPIQEAAAKALFGEIEIRGRLPVTIPGLYSLGHGIQKPALSRGPWDTASNLDR